MQNTDAGARADELLELVRRHGRLEVTAAARTLAVSPETIRRDLRRLEADGLVRRGYGIALPVESSSFETALADRTRSSPDEKRRIADAAVERLGAAHTIFIDEGFQTLLLARALPRDRELTVVTSSLPVASELSVREHLQVVLLGGRVRGRTLGVVDGWATDMLATLRIDLAFIGANGVTVEDGLTTPDPAVARVKAAAIAASRRRVFVGAHHKFGVTSFARFAGLDEFETVITGVELNVAQSRKLRGAGPEIVRI